MTAQPELIERVAREMWAWDYEESTGFEARVASWPDIENPDHYRGLARIAIHAVESSDA